MMRKFLLVLVILALALPVTVSAVSIEGTQESPVGEWHADAVSTEGTQESPVGVWHFDYDNVIFEYWFLDSPFRMSLTFEFREDGSVTFLMENIPIKGTWSLDDACLHIMDSEIPWRIDDGRLSLSIFPGFSFEKTTASLKSFVSKPNQGALTGRWRACFRESADHEYFNLGLMEWAHLEFIAAFDPDGTLTCTMIHNGSKEAESKYAWRAISDSLVSLNEVKSFYAVRDDRLQLQLGGEWYIFLRMGEDEQPPAESAEAASAEAASAEAILTEEASAEAASTEAVESQAPDAALVGRWSVDRMLNADGSLIIGKAQMDESGISYEIEFTSDGLMIQRITTGSTDEQPAPEECHYTTPVPGVLQVNDSVICIYGWIGDSMYLVDNSSRIILICTKLPADGSAAAP